MLKEEGRKKKEEGRSRCENTIGAMVSGIRNILTVKAVTIYIK
jgi:hypothetical protein